MISIQKSEEIPFAMPPALKYSNVFWMGLALTFFYRLVISFELIYSLKLKFNFFENLAMFAIMNPTPVDFVLIDNGSDVAFGVSSYVDHALILHDAIIFERQGDFFKLAIGDDLFQQIKKQKEILLVTFGMSGPLDEYLIKT